FTHDQVQELAACRADSVGGRRGGPAGKTGSDAGSGCAQGAAGYRRQGALGGIARRRSPVRVQNQGADPGRPCEGDGDFFRGEQESGICPVNQESARTEPGQQGETLICASCWW